MRRSLAYAALPAFSILFLACATGGTPSEEPDAGTINGNVDAGNVSGPDATPPDAAPMAVQLKQNMSDVITDLNTVSCNNVNGHAENSYYRVFDLAALGINTDLSVSAVNIAIENATSNGGSQPLQVRLHTLNGSFVTGNLTQILQAPVTLNDQVSQPLTVNLLGTVPGGSVLVVEVFLPDSNDNGNMIFLGSNQGGQTAPTYIRAAECAFAEPIDMANIGVAGSDLIHLIMSVDGIY